VVYSQLTPLQSTPVLRHTRPPSFYSGYGKRRIACSLVQRQPTAQYLIDLPLGYPLEATQERMGERREREREREREKFHLLTIKK
jgi:hypothetical protein